MRISTIISIIHTIMDVIAAAVKLRHIRIPLRKALGLLKQIELAALSTCVSPYTSSVVKAAITILENYK